MGPTLSWYFGATIWLLVLDLAVAIISRFTVTPQGYLGWIAKILLECIDYP